MDVRVTRTTNKTIAACAIAIEGSSSSNNKTNYSDSCDRRVDAVAAARTT